MGGNHLPDFHLVQGKQRWPFRCESSWGKSLATRPGLEPEITEPKSAVLPITPPGSCADGDGIQREGNCKKNLCRFRGSGTAHSSPRAARCHGNMEGFSSAFSPMARSSRVRRFAITVGSIPSSAPLASRSARHWSNYSSKSFGLAKRTARVLTGQALWGRPRTSSMTSESSERASLVNLRLTSHFPLASNSAAMVRSS